ncbi:MAG: hypothetical protein K2H79_06395 [Bacteroidaceae bacterium]|nr:hypothetical protein [Bacteroidaceae bacterium]
MKWDIDFGDNMEQESPLAERKSVSILLGAGFSAPMGYPIGNNMNNGLLNFDDSSLDFSPCGTLATSTDGIKPAFQMDGFYNNHQKYFTFCKRLIKEYTNAHGNTFDYEQFYDFIKTEEVKQERYQRLCDDLLRNSESYEHYIVNVSHIYNQMVAHLLKDRTGKSWYDDEPFKVNFFDGYNGFLIYLSELSKKFIVNVHTLNHDLLFESFNNTGFINGNISDGFDEYGSEYYGKLTINNRTYHCRLERYKGNYNTPIRLFKLHGSLDYVPFYRQNKYGGIFPENYVKIKEGIGAGHIMKSRKSKRGYDKSPFEDHADFLTGTTSKIQRYKEPLLFKKLFKKFRKNLRDAERLIIIGYGCKDEGINEMIKENFDYIHKPSFFVDAYAKEGSQVDLFKEELQARLLKVQINDINKNLFI